MTQELDVGIADPNPIIALNPQDIAALGATLASAGFTRLQVQARMGRIQQIAAQVALNTLSDTMEDIRQVQESRLWEIINLIRALPSAAGYVNRDRVIQVIQMVASKTPRQ